MARNNSAFPGGEKVVGVDLNQDLPERCNKVEVGSRISWCVRMWIS